MSTDAITVSVIKADIGGFVGHSNITHRHGDDSDVSHGLAWRVFEACTQKARELKLYGAGQDLLADAFSGNVRGLGPGVAEMTFVERGSEPIIVFMADKTSAGAWNLPLFRLFADPFNTTGEANGLETARRRAESVLDVLEV